MAENVNNIYGGYDEEEEFQSSYIQFGLNQNVFLTDIKYYNNADKGYEALDLTYTCKESTIRQRLFQVNGGWNKGKLITDPKSAYFKAAVKAFKANRDHMLSCFIDKAQIKEAFDTKQISSFEQYCKIFISLLPQNFKEVPLDAFAQYQYKIVSGGKTYLEFPSEYINFSVREKDGKEQVYARWKNPWIIPHMEGDWKQQLNMGVGDYDVALKYVNSEGAEHPFTRTKSFMKSKVASQQVEGEVSLDKAAQATSDGNTAWATD